MAIRADSFSSAAEVTAYTRHLLDGQSAFNSTTRPTVTELEKFIDRSSGLLNMALRSAGFTPSAVYANSTAKLACDDWVTTRAVKYVELTQRGTGYNADEGSRTAAFENDAGEFVELLSDGLINSGIAQNAGNAANGLQYTGMTVESDRADPSDSSRAQPLFTRRGFDNA
jgi:hypothetical protein